MKTSKSLLQVLQANIIQPNEKKHNRCVFLTFSPKLATAPSLRFLADTFLRTFGITTAAQAITKVFTNSDNALMRTCYFSYTGLQKLGLDTRTFEEYRGFCLGMAKSLNESRSKWDTNYQIRLDAMLLLASNNKAVIEADYERLVKHLQARDLLTQVSYEDGECLYNTAGQHIEHFGFRDGISQPRIWKDDGTLDAAYLKKSFLVEESGGAYGSFFVLQKYRQDVALFEQKIAALATTLEVDTEFAAAQVVGRFRNGMPLHLSDKAEAIHTPELQQKIKDFDENKLGFDADDKLGIKCPFHAHIRKMNPRDKSLLSGMFYPKAPRKFTIEILRRSIPYTTSEQDKGMLFMSYQCDIRRQFETLLRWRDTTTFPDGALGIGMDPLISNTSELKPSDQQRWLKKWGQANYQTFSFSDVVELRGGGYFYCPSLVFFQNMEKY